MTTLRALFPACAPAYLARYPNLPLAHRKVISAIRHCPSGHDGHSLSQCARCGEHHRVQHAWGNRPCPQGPQHTTQQWLEHPREKPLPGPHVLRTCTVPETLRPCIRSPQRLASHAMFHASSRARKRLATDERCIGTDLPGFPGVLHTWGRQRQSHPHLHSMVPGGGLSADRTTWLPSRANFFVPVKALSPLSRAIFKEDMPQAGLLDHIDPQVWTIPWNVHSQARPHGHAACTSLAPYVFKVAISHHRLVSLTGRTVTFPSRTVGRARLRTAHLDVMEFLRRFLQHVWPDGLLQVRHCGVLHARCPLPLAPIRRMIVPAPPDDDQPPPRPPPPPHAARCPPCGAPMRVVMRLWTSSSDLVDTGGAAGRCPDELRTTRCGPPTAPVRPPPARRQLQAADDGSATAFQRLACAARYSAEAPLTRPHSGVRPSIPPRS